MRGSNEKKLLDICFFLTSPSSSCHLVLVASSSYIKGSFSSRHLVKDDNRIPGILPLLDHKPRVSNALSTKKTNSKLRGSRMLLHRLSPAYNIEPYLFE